MEKIQLIQYNKIKQILENNSFYAHTAKKLNNNKIIYKFLSIKWLYITVTVETLKINNQKIILGIKVNDKQLNSFKEFINMINNIYTTNKNCKNDCTKKN